MPTHLRRERFGPYTLVTVGDADNAVWFVPEASAYVHQVRLGGRDLLCHYRDGEALDTNLGHFNLSLLPFPNRLARGRFRWNDAAYAFPVNDEATPAALHGYNHEARFAVASVDLSPESAKVTLSLLNHDRDYPRYDYPFAALFEVTFAVDTVARRFSFTLSARNLEAAAIPVGLGWHPYFALPGGLEAWRVVMPGNRKVELRNALPTGALSEGLPPRRPLAIDASWDDCFLLDDPRDDATVELRGPGYSLSLKQGGDTRYTQLFVPPREVLPKGHAIAVEPMTCGVNAFADAPAEVALAPGLRTSTALSIGLEDVSALAE